MTRTIIAFRLKSEYRYMFKDRKDAGKKLAGRLIQYRGKNTIVLAIPRGGVEVGCEVARALNAPFSVLVVRKLPFPDNPEAGFGAIAEDGSVILLKDALSWLPEAVIERIKEKEIHEIQRRVAVLRDGHPLTDIGKKTVILVDDGLAMGSTMLAAIACCRKKKPSKIIVAVPIAGKETFGLVDNAADKALALEKPSYFYAVAQGYENWYDVSDEEVLNILNTYYINFRAITLKNSSHFAVLF